MSTRHVVHLGLEIPKSLEVEMTAQLDRVNALLQAQGEKPVGFREAFLLCARAGWGQMMVEVAAHEQAGRKVLLPDEVRLVQS